MPFSQSSQLSSIVGFAEGLQPKSVLDVGTGMGQYGFLLRNNLEAEGLFEIDGPQGRQRPKAQWRIRIDGIEGFAGYLTPVHEWAYQRVLVGDALQVLATLPDRAYELVLAIDILEHFEKADGWKLLAELARVSSRAALVSTPRDFHAQRVEANPLEDHRSHWTAADLLSAGYARVLENGESLIAVLQAQRDQADHR
jgi:ubiquinone/menaquinone biosynthesis C-methylase UbiE